jgi:hypothetical protein
LDEETFGIAEVFDRGKDMARSASRQSGKQDTSTEGFDRCNSGDDSSTLHWNCEHVVVQHVELI